MGDQKVYVFLDEYGTPDLDVLKEGVEPYFVYAALIIKEENLQKARDILEILYSKYFKQRYIKSTHIFKSENSFNLINNALFELQDLECYVRALIVDKEKIKSEGLTYEKSFIKYFQNIFSRTLIQNYDEIHICFDKTGYPEFWQSLKEYMEKHLGLGRTLFSNNEYRLADDRTEEPLLQLADLYAGIIGRFCCGKYDVKRSEFIRDNYLRSKLSLNWFPEETISFIAASASFDSTFDEELMRIGYESAQKYIAENTVDISGCELLKYVIQESRLSPLRYISSKEIRANLKNRGIEIGDPIIKVSELRDKGVVLISPRGKKGYKFPHSQEEFAEFLNRLSDNVVPQLRRGYQLNKIVLEKSTGKYNVLNSSEFSLLMDLCERVMSH